MQLKSLIFSLLVASNLALDPIIAKGNKLFNKKTGEAFYVKGIAYQPRSNAEKGSSEDPLAFPDRCKRDIEKFKDLGVNMIRVYEVDPSKDHSGCMKQLEEAGIYLALDLPIPKFSINRSDPSYTLEIIDHYKQNVDEFDKYDNVAFYFAGNEINNNITNTNANPFVKAGLRDIKAYVATKKHKVLVGYANNDDKDTRKNIEDYFACGKEEERAEFYAINVYSWCNSKSFKDSGYYKLTEELKDYPLPVFFSEYGCNKPRTREFVSELQSMYGTDMEEAITGGIMYEYTQEDNDYGIVKITGNKVEKLKDYDNFKKALSKISPKSFKIDSYTPKNTKFPNCPATSDKWQSSEKLPPTPSSEKCKCFVDTFECAVKGKVDGKKIGEIFGSICGDIDCKVGLGNDAEKGEYGPMSGCSAIDQLSWALNEAYIKSGKNADACTGSDGIGEVKSPKGDSKKCGEIKVTTPGGGNNNGGKGSNSNVAKISGSFLAFSLIGGYFL